MSLLTTTRCTASAIVNSTTCFMCDCIVSNWYFAMSAKRPSCGAAQVSGERKKSGPCTYWCRGRNSALGECGASLENGKG